MNHTVMYTVFFSEAVERSHGKLSMPMEDEQAELQCAKEVCGMNTTTTKIGFLHNIISSLILNQLHVVAIFFFHFVCTDRAQSTINGRTKTGVLDIASFVFHNHSQ